MNSLEIISTFIYNNTEKFSVHVWKDFDLSVWKIKHYFCLLWISKIFITHLTRQRTEYDPRRSVFWSAHQRLVIIKPSLKQTLFSFSSMKVGFHILCNCAGRWWKQHELQPFEAACDPGAKKAPDIYLHVFCISEDFTNELQIFFYFWINRTK